jgi:hypothetical protein
LSRSCCKFPRFQAARVFLMKCHGMPWPSWRCELWNRSSVCGKATKKVDPGASLKFYCGGPLFGGSRPLTAQKGVQAAGKGSKSEIRCRWTPFWRIQTADNTKRGPAARKWNVGSWKSKIAAARPLFDRFGLWEPEKGVQQPEKSQWSKATLLDPFLQDFGCWAVKKEPRKLLLSSKKEPKVYTKILQME